MLASSLFVTDLARRALPRSMVPLFVIGLCTALWANTALAAKADKFQVVIQVIEASRTGNKIDPALKSLKQDLRNLPFKSYTVVDKHHVQVKQGDRVSFEIPGGKGKRRFLKVTAHGQQRTGKLRFQLTIDELKFDTLVAVPNRGTILVGGPRHGKNTLLLAVTARKQR